MSDYPKIQLQRLREIGWDKWDPIGLRTVLGGWEASGADDEYDGYLLHVVDMLRNGDADEEAVAYLD